jgi:hypothetical protein
MAADLRERVARAIAGIVCKGIEIDAAWPQYLPEADAVLAELGLTQAAPVGEWVMVPHRPTEAMGAAAEKWQAAEYVSDPLGDRNAFYFGVYRAMLEAAPQPQKAEFPKCSKCGQESHPDDCERPAKLEHEASANCWCEPTLEHVDPDTGAKVWLHRETH